MATSETTGGQPAMCWNRASAPYPEATAVATSAMRCEEALALARVDCARGAEQLGGIGDDVERGAGGDAPDRDHRRRER